MLTSVRAESITTTGATIRWTTDRAATSHVDYWVAGTSTVRTATVDGMVTSHGVPLAGLSLRTMYS